MNTLRRISQIRAGGRTERCHGIPHQGSYCNAKHQWGVAMLMYVLWPDDFPRLGPICLTHDIPEAWLGDIPATTKRYARGVREVVAPLEDRIQRSLGLPEEGALNADDQEKFRSCDHLELYIWGLEQLLQGNMFVQEMVFELENFFSERPFRFREAAELYSTLRDLRRGGLLNEILPLQARVVSELCRDG